MNKQAPRNSSVFYSLSGVPILYRKRACKMLEGIKILSFTHYLQGPSAAQNLADLGADVVKVEPCKGAYERHWSGCNTYKNGVSVFFLCLNRNQRSLAVDLKSDEGKELIYRLVRDHGYDVIIENFRPGVMTKLGLGYDRIREINSRVIYCSCSGYGTTGPKAKATGQDLLMQGMSGLAALSGHGDRPPVPAGTTLVDQHGAALAALGITAAVYDRARTGKGHKIDASLLGSALDLQVEPFNIFLNGGQLSPRASTGHSTRFHQSPYGIYATADSYIILSLTPFEKLEQAFGVEALRGFIKEDQMNKKMEFDQMVCAEMRKRTTAEWQTIFKELDIWHHLVNEYDDVVNDEQVIHNQCVMTMEHPVAGTIKVLGHANRYDGKPLSLRKLPPDLGEATLELLETSGFTKEEIEKLQNENKVFIPDEKVK